MGGLNGAFLTWLDIVVASSDAENGAEEKHLMQEMDLVQNSHNQDSSPTSRLQVHSNL